MATVATDLGVGPYVVLSYVRLAGLSPLADSSVSQQGLGRGAHEASR